MLIQFRRFLAIVALMFWQGGFTFYAAVVVPIGQEVLGSHLEQGFITREVTWYMNLAGAVALGVLGVELWASRDCKTTRRRLRWWLWTLMTIALVALAVSHPWLNALIVVDEHIISDRNRFRTLHRIYLWISTVQWMLGGVYLWLMIGSWRMEARGEEKKCPADGHFGVAQSPELPLSETTSI